ncbi:MAG: Glutathione transport system permease protein GsiC [Phycisphaerae bacterium]|nr:Glutathione transport system permease protein GsiC [Phycisphaerae bacterium]
MTAYIIRRLLYVIPILIGIVLITFLLFRAISGDPTDRIAGKLATKEYKDELRHQLGFDKPLWPQFSALHKGDYREFADNQLFNHFKDTFTLNFGQSTQYKQDISTMVKNGAGPSLAIQIPSFIIALFLEITIAMVCAFQRGRILDRLIVVLSLLGMSFPFLAFIIFGQYYLAYKLGWFPISGYPSHFGPGVLRYVALPVVLGVIAGLGGGVRFYRTVMLDESNADYVRTARAKGVGETSVMFRHVLKNAMIPIITQVVVIIPFLFLGSLLLERYFGIPGLGAMMAEAVDQADWPVLNAMTFVGSLIYLSALIVTDICYAMVDPRVSLR